MVAVAQRLNVFNGQVQCVVQELAVCSRERLQTVLFAETETFGKLFNGSTVPLAPGKYYVWSSQGCLGEKAGGYEYLAGLREYSSGTDRMRFGEGGGAVGSGHPYASFTFHGKEYGVKTNTAQVSLSSSEKCMCVCGVYVVCMW